MFGLNPLRRTDFTNGEALLVHSVFDTIQGEGPYSGQPAVFIRLGGCNLRCHFCDTDFETGNKFMEVPAILERVRAIKSAGVDLVVLTGGEPLRQNVRPLLRALSEQHLHVQIETAGTVWPPGLENDVISQRVTLVCSPKTPVVNKMVALLCNHWKYVVSVGDEDVVDGLPVNSTQVRNGPAAPLYRPPALYENTIWVQPCMEYTTAACSTAGAPPTAPVEDVEATRANMLHAASIARQHGYRITLQTHKLLGLP